MTAINQIRRDEWRFWHRTKLAATVIVIGTILTFVSAIVNTIAIEDATHEREHLQQTSEAQFLAQPDRHPHRMVHYGHYVFRPPSPLSIIEPGVDAFTGTSIFLEGHRQNSAMFSDQRQASGMTRFSSLTPSFLLQVLVPLFIILIGYASVTREKEAGTLHIMITQGVNLWHLLIGKYLALVSSGLLMQSRDDINQLYLGDVALLKGEGWFKNEGGGLVHRSPSIANEKCRLLLTLDFID